MGDPACSGKSSAMFIRMTPYILMVCTQFGSAGNCILNMLSLHRGMNRYVLIVYRNGVAALVFAPFALLLERKIRPKMTLSVVLQIMALALLEPILDQGFGYLGLKYTSATFAAAFVNVVPSATFVIAMICGLERVRIKEIRSEAKIIGTLVTFGGALLMTMYQVENDKEVPGRTEPNLPDMLGGQHSKFGHSTHCSTPPWFMGRWLGHQALHSPLHSEKLHLGSIIGGIVIVIGLYFVVWGKSKDYSTPEVSTTDEKDDHPQELPVTTINVATTN
ncbi:unnamed protein product [Dovyalis caffra]|uniref:WAT1-related protein n=1 Tax=Dovyalis caffra TaxID=77055 RepID=A0AAV1S915_9ROSI|nr:unnamed protein product [Dovyalis caffra]